MLCAISGFIAAAAGCQSGDSAAVLDPGKSDKPAEEKVTEAELRAFCPKVVLREGTAYFNTYQKGAQDDPTKIIYQASITDVTRTCQTADGSTTMNVAVAGKIVPGPAFAPGTIVMPIRVVVTHGDEVLYTNLAKHNVDVSDPTAATQFVFNDANVSFVMPADKGVRVYAGYDEGTKPQKAAATE